MNIRLVIVLVLIVGACSGGGNQGSSGLSEVGFDPELLELTPEEMRANLDPPDILAFAFGIQRDVLGIAPSGEDVNQEHLESSLRTTLDALFNWPNYYDAASTETEPLVLFSLFGTESDYGALGTMLHDRATSDDPPMETHLAVISHDSGKLSLEVELDGDKSMWDCEVLLYWTSDRPSDVSAAGYYLLSDCSSTGEN